VSCIDFEVMIVVREILIQAYIRLYIPSSFTMKLVIATACHRVHTDPE